MRHNATRERRLAASPSPTASMSPADRASRRLAAMLRLPIDTLRRLAAMLRLPIDMLRPLMRRRRAAWEIDGLRPHRPGYTASN